MPEEIYPDLYRLEIPLPESPLKYLNSYVLMDCGRYHFQCVTTPGHTLGHICLYEADRKILIAGDHILDDITPNIQCWSDDQNPLTQKWFATGEAIAHLRHLEEEGKIKRDREGRIIRYKSS